MNEVAIKVIRANEMMTRAGEKEIGYLETLKAGDPENKKHCILYYGKFQHQGHLCMVFEAMHQNLRQALKQHGHRRGIQIDAVQLWTRQLLISLKYLHKHELIHADLKPDNVVVSSKYNVVKLCDFGSAMSAEDTEITPYLVSRFYRAPEIMLGLTYTYPIDIWSAACTCFELYSGTILFQGNSNNMMLKYICDVKGKISNKILKRGAFTEMHFDEDFNLMYTEKDKVTGKQVTRPIVYGQEPLKGKDIKSQLIGNAKLKEPELKKLALFADLLEKMLTIDPSKRLTATQALKHPFCAAANRQ